MRVRQLHPLFMGEISGLDTSAPVTAETIQAVEDAMAKYAVCVIRNASLNDEDHLRFARAFGPLELAPPGGKRISEGLYDIGNLTAEGEIVPENPDAKAKPTDFELFHTDSPFNSLPTKWSLLLCYVTPPEGANTEYVDTRAVYDDLSQEMKDKIENLVVEHDMFRALQRNGVEFGDDNMRKAYPRMSHPLVRTSASGRKALYMGWHAVGIVGWERGRRLQAPRRALCLRDTRQIRLFAQMAAGRHGDLGQSLHHAQRDVLRTLSLQARFAPRDNQ